MVGTTIAELGNGNQPLDMVSYKGKDGKDYLLLTNNRRGVMKIPASEFGTAPAIKTKPPVPGGVKYDTVSELKDVVQLDKLDDARAVIVVKTDAGFDLKTIPLP